MDPKQNSGRPQAKNFALKHYVRTFPYRGYPHDVSEDGRRSMITLFMKTGSLIEDFKALAEKTGLENALPGEPDFDIHTDYRPHNQIHARAGDVFQIFVRRTEECAIELTIYGLMEDIMSFIGCTEEGELISPLELRLGSTGYHLIRGEALLNIGDIDEAIKAYERGVYFGSRTRIFREQQTLDEVVATLHYRLGLAFREKRENPKAIQEFETYLKHDSTTEWAEQARKYISELSGK